jgi:alkaline phosphatase D
VLDGLKSVATEYVGGSVTSSGVPAEIGGLAAVAIQAVNPHIRYFEGAKHGWARVDASASELKVDYRTSDITTEGATVSSIASFRQQAGENDFERTDGGILGTTATKTVGVDKVALPAAAGSKLALRRTRYENAVMRDFDRRTR